MPNPTDRLGVTRMLENVTGLVSGPVASPPGVTKNIQVTADGTGAITASVVIEGTNNLDPRDWVTLATVNLTGTTHIMSGSLNTDAWAYIRCRVSAISGTGTKVNAHMVAL